MGLWTQQLALFLLKVRVIIYSESYRRITLLLTACTAMYYDTAIKSGSLTTRIITVYRAVLDEKATTGISKRTVEHILEILSLIQHLLKREGLEKSSAGRMTACLLRKKGLFSVFNY